MRFDVFFSLTHAPAGGVLPSEGEMIRNFFAQVEAADRLGFECAWIAESHLSTQVQKGNPNPVVPHFEGEIGINVDVFQLAHQVFSRTSNIEVGSAVMNILCNGGPVAAAERVAAFCALHGANPEEARQLHIGFSAGRFDFMNRAYGIVPRNAVEEAAWPALKGKVFGEACNIFLRLLKGETVGSESVPATTLTRGDFRSEEDWECVRTNWLETYGQEAPEVLEIEPRFIFEPLKIIPQDWRRELLDLVVGSHDPNLQEALNQHLPVKVFNLSITDPELIEDTHARMEQSFHDDGGAWERGFMPRTTMVFLDPDGEAARARAQMALGEYWKALEGTLDVAKVEKAAGNALVGTPAEVIQQATQRFHPDERLMLWFDFQDHDCERVIRGLKTFQEEVAPALKRASQANA
ncbi:MAG TPA: luciferase [Planctomycetes bacterium]|nr:luciferase [Planctomycetota bacterium]